MRSNRQDAWANAHRIPVEQDKPALEQGYYLHPDLYGESEQKRIGSAYSPELITPALSR
jgi:trimeric autotransporter adhesin